MAWTVTHRTHESFDLLVKLKLTSEGVVTILYKPVEI